MTVETFVLCLGIAAIIIGLAMSVLSSKMSTGLALVFGGCVIVGAPVVLSVLS